MSQEEKLHQLLEDIGSVLTILPEVTVDSIDSVSITLCINQLDSLAVVTYASDGANLPLHLWSVASGRTNIADQKYLRYRLVLLGRSVDDAIESFEVFGCFLVGYLVAAGLLAEENANMLLEKWNTSQEG
jgi:hypothetical protein